LQLKLQVETAMFNHIQEHSQLNYSDKLNRHKRVQNAGICTHIFSTTKSLMTIQ